jgi:hypothetical protein
LDVYARAALLGDFFKVNCDALGAIEIVGNMAWFYLVQDQSCVDDPRAW